MNWSCTIGSEVDHKTNDHEISGYYNEVYQKRPYCFNSRSAVFSTLFGFHILPYSFLTTDLSVLCNPRVTLKKNKPGSISSLIFSTNNDRSISFVSMFGQLHTHRHGKGPEKNHYVIY